MVSNLQVPLLQFGSKGKQRPIYQLGVGYQISLQLRLATTEEVPILESSMRKETRL
jgi:hypothetical protein